ncbi:AAA family ATPase [Dactylosporangium matsuzakiense]|uniref:Adenylate kinase n=1 Tax=Dactylosporangium matsuzakiense TaxID=53360 RepID=A0A9W6NSE3_9ACTN|nr:AAA family ATPase [Dactylosporangium matsuzakiense]GLL07241.1 hypothetical protein GCM10017581_089930 [Dactylosporangium matsuzakiense]
MTAQAPLEPICVIGPPGAGKTTLSEALGSRLNVSVLRPRELADFAAQRYPATAGLFQRDAAGLISDEALGLALRISLEQHEGFIVFENLPWSVVQLVDLYRAAGRALRVVALDGPDELLLRRRAERRYCPRCYPRPAGRHSSNTCGTCGTKLAARPDDEHDAFLHRLHERRETTTKILKYAAALHVHVLPMAADHQFADDAIEPFAAVTRWLETNEIRRQTR